MKILILIVSFLSLGAYAQDGYHEYFEERCHSDNCLLVDGRGIEMVTQVDFEGYTYTKVNRSSSLTDVITEDKTICFTGSVAHAKRVIKALAGNSQASYSNGAHDVVRELKVNETVQGIEVFADVKSDYGDYDIEAQVARCE